MTTAPQRPPAGIGRCLGWLVVLGGLVVVAATAIPSFSSVDRKRRNEAVAIGQLKEWAGAQRAFCDEDREKDGAADFGTLDELRAADLLEATHAGPLRSGYSFSLTLGPGRADWSATAAPVATGITGVRCFFIDSTGVVRWAEGAAAGPRSPTLGP